jgi:hypothetical protein
MSPEGGINFRGETMHHITLLQGYNCFITSNILHSVYLKAGVICCIDGKMTCMNDQLLCN